MINYRQYVAHGVKFIVEGTEGRHTWDDWRLVPTERPTIATPEPQLNYVHVPGSNLDIDLSQVISGRVTYGPREGSLEFAVMNRANWRDVNEEITNYLAGKHCRVVLDDDPDYYYEGRCWVDGYVPGGNYSNIVINYRFGPFKIPVEGSLENWTYSPLTEYEGIL